MLWSAEVLFTEIDPFVQFGSGFGGDVELKSQKKIFKLKLW